MTTMTKQFMAVLFGLLILATVSCGAGSGDDDNFGYVCPAVETYSIVVTVYGETDADPIWTADVFAIDDDGQEQDFWSDITGLTDDELEEIGDLSAYNTYYLFGNRGTHTVYVEADDYETYEEEIEVAGSVCSPETEHRTVYLTEK